MIEVEKMIALIFFSTFFIKKYVSRLRMCEKSSTFVAKYVVSPIWQAKMQEKTAKKHKNQHN